MQKYCIVRNLANIHEATAPMLCDNAMTVAQSGKCVINWSLQACQDNQGGSAPLHSPILMMFNDDKYELMTQDIDINGYFQSNIRCVKAVKFLTKSDKSKLLQFKLIKIFCQFAYL